MPECASDDDLYKTASSATGGHTDYTAEQGRNTYNPYEEYNRRQEQTQREATVDATSTAGAANGPTGQRVTPGDQRTIRSTSKFIRNLIDKATEEWEARANYHAEARNMVSGLTTGNVSRWLHGIFKIDNWFRHQRNAMNEWIYAVARDPDVPHWQQRLAQMFDAMPNKIRAIHNDFAGRQSKLIDSLRPTAKRLGLKVEWLANVLGHYAVMRHIPEANAELIRAWRKDLADGIAKLQEIQNNPGKNVDPRYVRDLTKHCSELEFNIGQLEANLESATKPKDFVSAGYTNRQAREMMEQILRDTGVTREEAEAFSRAIQDEFNYILQKRVEAGLVHPNQLAAFPDFQNYVALMSRKENLQGAVNDARRYDPGSYHQRQGMHDEPDSAMDTLSYLGNRAATEMGMQEFATHLNALKQVRGKGAGAIGLKSASYETLVQWRNSTSRRQQEKADNILDAGGLVIDVPVTDTKTGKTEFERQYLWFDADWKGEGAMKNITGKTLNDAISSNYKIGSKFFDYAGRATSYHGQLYTRFSLGFAPVGGTRDGMERMVHMLNRTYVDDAGNQLSRWGVVKDYILNTKKAAGYMYEALTKSPENMSPEARQFWEEYNAQGLYQKYTPAMQSERMSASDALKNKPQTVAELLRNPEATFLNEWVGNIGDAGRKALNTLDKWNDWWQNIPALAQFMTLRQKGLSASRAGAETLEMMNMQQRGSLTPYLRIISPFVVPTVQSAAAFGRTLGLNAASPKDILKQGWRGWLAVLGSSAAFSVINNAARESMGYDEDGNSRYDAMPVRDLVSWVPIGLDDNGTYFKAPIGFGPVRLGQALSVCTDRISRGLMSMEDAAGEIIFTVAKDILPTTNPQFKFKDKPGEFIMQMLTPDVLKPVMEVSSNTNYFGSQIADSPNEGVARADQGRTSTDPFWHQVARFFQRYGIVDAPPEHFKHLAQSYGAGPIRALGAVFDTITGRQTVTSSNYDPDGFEELSPWLRAFGGTMYFGRTKDISRGMYYDYRRQLDEKIQRAGVKLSSPENKGKPEKAAEYRIARLEDAGFTREEIEDYEIMHAGHEALKKINRSFDDEYKDAFVNMDYPDELRAKFAEMDDAKKAIYADIIQNLNYYRYRR